MFLGSFDVASSQVDSVEDIHHRFTAALEHIDADRLTAVLDSGLGILGEDFAGRTLQPGRGRPVRGLGSRAGGIYLDACDRSGR